MTTKETLQEILSQLTKLNARDDDLWTKKDICSYAKMSGSSVDKVIAHRKFPAAIKAPTGINGSRPRWVAGEVKRFFLQQRAH